MVDTVAPEKRSEPDYLADDAVALVTRWLSQSVETSSDDRQIAERLGSLVDDPTAVSFTMRFVDRVMRPDNPATAAHQLKSLVVDSALPSFLAPVDRLLLRAGAVLAPLIPRVVMPLARRRVRSLVGHLIADSDPDTLQEHLARRRAEGYEMNVNLLGEAILGEAEAERRFTATIDLIRDPAIDYVSVKVSAIASQLNLWAYDQTLDRIVDRLRVLYTEAGATVPPTFVNLDMEEYRDLDLTLDAFMRLLDEMPQLDAGIVLQTYLPDTFAALRRLVTWANARHRSGGGSIKIRLVKGANLAMERVEAEMHGWDQAPYDSKPNADANFKRCLDWVLHPERLDGVRIGVGSHNLFDIAWARLVSLDRDVAGHIEFEMLQGMAPAQSETVRAETSGMLLYTPVVADTDFDTAIGYLFRRLDENASDDNFLKGVLTLRPGSESFRRHETVFRRSLETRWLVSAAPRRRQDRNEPTPATNADARFANEADTDTALPANRAWITRVLSAPPRPVDEPVTTTQAAVDARVAVAKVGSATWAAVQPPERREVLLRVADELDARRMELMRAMIHEASKTLEQADPEISEAIDFARYYADRALDTTPADGPTFTPLGVIAVVPPWNFPVAIPTGGVLASLAAGNAVLFKPAPETPRCAEIVAEACWAAGVPDDALQFIRTPDDDVGRHLITHPDVGGVILTGAFETAQLFRSWKPDIRLFAETSGKNALIVTQHADLDLAAADLVASAFGHAGQKCSAASLGILVGDAFDSPRFRRQLVDAATSLHIGRTDAPETTLGPVIRPVEGKLERALTEPGANWLLRPERLDDDGRLWSPGIIDDVQPGSWFHQTECFGPVLGLMRARDLDHAIELQNQSDYGLTGGIHSLDPAELDAWTERVEVGNAYVNRGITGAIVQRQPFGGWKRSAIGPGAKAGGPNYVTQLGTWTGRAVPNRGEPPSAGVAALLRDETPAWIVAAAADDEWWWQHEFAVDHDPSALRAESNVFRYRNRPLVVIRHGANADPDEMVRVVIAASRTDTPFEMSLPPDAAQIDIEAPQITESDDELIGRLPPWTRIRVVGGATGDFIEAANAAELDVVDQPVVGSGRRELLWFLREQAVSRTRHRLGNYLDS